MSFLERIAEAATGLKRRLRHDVVFSVDKLQFYETPKLLDGRTIVAELSVGESSPYAVYASSLYTEYFTCDQADVLLRGERLTLERPFGKYQLTVDVIPEGCGYVVHYRSMQKDGKMLTLRRNA